VNTTPLPCSSADSCTPRIAFRRPLPAAAIGGFELDELGVVIAETVGRLDVDRDGVAGFFHVERSFDLRQHSRVSAVQIGDRFRARFEQHAVGVEELERKRDDRVGNDVHRLSVRWGNRGQRCGAGAERGAAKR
jgi:hypothetical protein